VDPQGPELAELLALPCNTFAAGSLMSAQGLTALVDAVRGGAGTVRACLEQIPRDDRMRAVRSLGWLGKYGVLRFDTHDRTAQ
jgi:repressor of nif and glnA expression